MYTPETLSTWIASIRSGDRNALSRAITLIESQLPEDRIIATELIHQMGSLNLNSFRIGITGPPGAGKSSLIETLGLHLIRQNYKVAVLSIDPSSALTKGSILGDKTRMQNLAVEPNAFIRPSPTGNQFGGVARHTRESIWLCEAAGFDYILVETAGIGQSEYLVSTMTDLTILISLPGSGDDLQGIKKGILEWADIIVINKADDDKDNRLIASYKDLLVASQFTQSRYPGWDRKILKISALYNKGIDSLVQEIEKFKLYIKENQAIKTIRQQQMVDYFNQNLKDKFWETLEQNPELSAFLIQTKKSILHREISPEEATDISLAFIFALFNKK